MRHSASASGAPARPLHVLVIIDGLGWGGAEMLLPHFVKAVELAGVRVSVAYLHDKQASPAAARLREVGVEPVHVDAGGLVSPRSLARAHRHIARVRPDLVHAHLGYSELLGGLGAGLLGVPVVSTIHLTRWSETHRERLKLRLIDAARWSTCSRVVTVSDAARVAYLREGWALHESVVTIRNCISDEARPGAGRRIRRELGIAQDEVVVGMLSVLRSGKGHRLAAEAIGNVRRELPQVRFVVAGDGPARRDVEAALEPLGSAAVLAGHRDDTMALLDSFDLFVLPSEHEAYPTVLLEAMAAGVPVVATAVGGVVEIVEDGVTGRLLAAPVTGPGLTDAVAQLVAAPALRAQMGAAGRRRFEDEHSLERWGRNLRALYEDVLAASPARLQRISRRTWSRGSRGGGQG